MELFDYFHVNRFQCPYIFMVIVMNSSENFPRGGGIPFNGAVNTGGGFVAMSSYKLDNTPGNIPEFQTTLQHELGHSFGLVHPSVYGYDNYTNESIMSYNLDHHWNGFEPPVNQGILIPEDLRILAKNKLVFPKFYFNEERDIPDNYQISDRIVYLGSMILPNDFPMHNQR